MSIQNDCRQGLDTLAGSAPKTKAAVVRSLLPGIEAALQSGQRLKDILEVLAKDGLQMSYRVFHTTVSRARKARKPTAACGWKTTSKPPEAQMLQETSGEPVEARDPLANLKRFEELRPGFHWRGRDTRNPKTSKHETEESHDKDNR